MQSNQQTCHTCRPRHIKCDGSIPIFQRCAKSHKVYVEADAAKQKLFTIHSENQYAAGRKRRPRGTRSTMVPLHSRFDLKTRAHAYYVQNHFQVFQDMPEMATTWAECLHKWKSDNKRSLIVNLAFSALALSVYARFQNCRVSETEACKSYLELLQHMRKFLLHIHSTNLDADGIDAYLLGAHFMALYESFVQNQNHNGGANVKPCRQIKVWYHFGGAAAVLKFWYDHRPRYAPTWVIKQSRRTLIKSSLIRKQPVPGWLADGSIFGESDVALDSDSLIIRFIDVHQRYLKVKQASADGEPVAQDLHDLVSESRELGHNLLHWSTRLPEKWQYVKHKIPENSDFPPDEFYATTVISCAKLSYSAVWTEYYALRMLTSHTHLRILDLLAPPENFEHRPETAEGLVDLTSSADSFAAIIPFCVFISTPTRDRSQAWKSQVNPSNLNEPALLSGPSQLLPVCRNWRQTKGMVSLGLVPGQQTVE